MRTGKKKNFEKWSKSSQLKHKSIINLEINRIITTGFTGFDCWMQKRSIKWSRKKLSERARERDRKKDEFIWNEKCLRTPCVIWLQSEDLHREYRKIDWKHTTEIDHRTDVVRIDSHDHFVFINGYLHGTSKHPKIKEVKKNERAKRVKNYARKKQLSHRGIHRILAKVAANACTFSIEISTTVAESKKKSHFWFDSIPFDRPVDGMSK